MQTKDTNRTELESGDAVIRFFEKTFSEYLVSEPEYEPDSLLSTYLRAVTSYLRGDRAELQYLEAQNKILPLQPYLAARLAILTQESVQAALNGLDSLRSQLPEKSIWIAEADFLSAFLYKHLGQNEMGARAALRASQLFEENSAPKKAARALNNYVAAKSRVDPKVNLLPEYFLVLKKAKSAEEFNLCGTLHFNISRQYQALGAFEVALSHSSSALEYYEAEMGTPDYYLGLCHHADLLMSMDRYAEALFYLKSAEPCPFEDVQNALGLLHSRRSQKPVVARSDLKLPDTFAYRIRFENQSVNTKLPLSDQENHLIEVLSQGPKNRVELIETLFGNQIEFEVGLNRIKAVLNRVRKKRPGLLVNKDGKYELSSSLYSIA